MNQKTFARDPFGLIFTILVTLAAIALSVFGPTGAWQALGTFLAAIAGAHVSWIIAHVNSIPHARELLRTELTTVSRRLGEIAGKLSQTTRQCSGGQIDSQTAVDRVAQQVGALYGLVNDLQLMSGEQFNADALITTVTTCEDAMKSISLRLESLEKDPNSPDIVTLRADAKNLQMQLASAVSLVSPKSDAVNISVNCPDCGERSSVKLGPSKGDSAMGWCQECHQRFHAHRGNNNDVYTKSWGSSYSNELPRTSSVSCPECSVTIPYAIKPFQDKVERYCISCKKVRVVIDKAGEIVKSETVEPIVSNYEPVSPTAPYFRCPECNSTTTFLKDDELNAYGACHQCRRLVIASKNKGTNNPMHQSGGPADS